MRVVNSLSIILLSILPVVNSFSPSVTFTSRTEHVITSSIQLNAERQPSRRDVIKESILGSAIVLTSSSFPAFASTDVVTNKVAAQSALRVIKRSIKALQTLEFTASDDNYLGIKEGLRVPPLTDVRKNANILIRAAGDNEEQTKELQSAYDEFIKSIEDLDSKAGLGARGRKGVTLIDSYDRSVKTLVSFQEVAERTVAIPLPSPTSSDVTTTTITE